MTPTPDPLNFPSTSELSDPDRRNGERRAVNLLIDGSAVTAYEGQTVAAVLLSEPVRRMRRTRSFRRTPSQEPRGLFCGMGVCFDCLVTIDGIPHVRACMTQVRSGMRVETTNEFRPSPSSIAHHPSPPPGNPHPAPHTLHAEIVVVGAGPAGIEAALAAADAGAQVILIDARPEVGGQYFQHTFAEPGNHPTPRQKQAAALRRHLAASPILCFTKTLVWGGFPDDSGWLLTLHGPDAPKRMRAQALIVASGAFDRPVAFPGWTLPGVMTAGAVQTLVKGQGVLPGQRFLFAGSGPLSLVAAAEVVKAGGEVAAVLEAAGWRSLMHPRLLPAMWGQGERIAEGWRAWRTLRRAGIPLRLGWGVTAALGSEEVAQVQIAQLDAAWRPLPDSVQTVAADTLVLGYGFLPANQFTRLLGCDHVFQAETGAWLPQRDAMMQTSLPGVYAAGDGAGVGGAALARLEGRIAGLAAARQVGRISSEEFAAAYGDKRAKLHREHRFARLLGELFTPRAGLYTLADAGPTAAGAVICRCEGVQLGDIRAAQTAGCRTLTEIKGLTRLGMGACQGRICGALAAQHFSAHTQSGEATDESPLLSIRPPLEPLALAFLAEAWLAEPDQEAAPT